MQAKKDSISTSPPARRSKEAFQPSSFTRISVPKEEGANEVLLQLMHNIDSQIMRKVFLLKTWDCQHCKIFRY